MNKTSSIRIVPVQRSALFAYAELIPATGHIIIAQSISDKIPVILSNKKFGTLNGNTRTTKVVYFLWNFGDCF
jgi:hypothetical protein